MEYPDFIFADRNWIDPLEGIETDFIIDEVIHENAINRNWIDPLEGIETGGSRNDSSPARSEIEIELTR